MRPSNTELAVLRFATSITDIAQGLIGLCTLGLYKPTLTMALVEAHAMWWFKRQDQQTKA